MSYFCVIVYVALRFIRAQRNNCQFPNKLAIVSPPSLWTWISVLSPKLCFVLYNSMKHQKLHTWTFNRLKDVWLLKSISYEICVFGCQHLQVCQKQKENIITLQLQINRRLSSIKGAAQKQQKKCSIFKWLLKQYFP